MTQIQANVLVDAASFRFRPRAHGPACNDNSGNGTYCPLCHKVTIPPAASEYHGKGLISHSWHCAACGHDWMTGSHVPH